MSALPASSLPPNATCTSPHASPASASAARTAWTPIASAADAVVAAERVDPGPDDRDAGHCARARRGAKANVLSPPSSTATTSIGLADPEALRVALGQHALDPERPGELDVADGVRARTRPSGPTYGGLGSKPCVVQVQSVPRRGSRTRSTAPPHAGQRRAEREARRRRRPCTARRRGAARRCSRRAGRRRPPLSATPASAARRPSRGPRCRPSRRRRAGRPCAP